jgi:signal transduction histidine kinase
VYSRSSYHKIEEIATENLSPWQICFLNKFAIRASLAIPIMIADTSQLWGLLIVQDCTSSRKWQQWEIDTLSSLTSQIAIAASQSQAQETQASLTEKSQQLENTLKELKDFQEQLLHNDKLASLGQIVINLTNEINNIINFIHSSVYITNKYTEDLIDFVEYKQFPVPTETTLQLQRLELDFIKTDFLKLVWSMRASCERIREIFSALQYLSLDENQMQKADLHQGFDHVLKILQHRLKERADRRGIQVVKEFGILPLIKCYKNDLNQVFIHILNNAIDALEEKIKEDNTFVPQIWISTEIVSSHLSLVRDNEVAGVGQLKKCKVIIRISDNGKGMLPHIQRQIFEPFFTTKPASRGLGLYISQQIIARQGKLKCNSRLGQGTEFIIEINTTIKPNADII